MIKVNKIVGYIPGVFDIFHSGHINLITNAMQMCDTIIIGVHTDKFTEKYKRKPKQNEQQRMKSIIDVFNLPIENVILVGESHRNVIIQYKINKITERAIHTLICAIVR